MSLRRRLTLTAAAAVAVAAVLGSVVAYVAARGVLRDQIDDSLRTRAGQAGLRFSVPVPGPGAIGVVDNVLIQPSVFAQIVDATGRVDAPGGERIEPDARVRAVARGIAEPFFSDETVDGVHVRVYTSAAAPGYAVQLARPLTEVDDALGTLRWILIAVALGGVGLAAALGRYASRTALRPVADLTAATEHVGRTGDLGRRIETTGGDEIARLARSFNAMLDALAGSRRAQRQLVADASHELRTPLTSLRTNLEVLAREDALAPPDRERLRADVVAQLEELTLLVGDLVELARDDEPPAAEALEDVRLDELVAAAVERAQRHAPGVSFVSELASPVLVRGLPARLDRAIANLLDNAAKWSPPGGEVEVRLHADGELTVRDHGPGIADEDRPHVFERFYRSADARSTPGSGLGLAIVRQVAESHDGHVTAEAPEGGGTRLRLSLSPTS